jgi:hypothetical protein
LCSGLSGEILKTCELGGGFGQIYAQNRATYDYDGPSFLERWDEAVRQLDRAEALDGALTENNSGGRRHPLVAFGITPTYVGGIEQIPNPFGLCPKGNTFCQTAVLDYYHGVIQANPGDYVDTANPLWDPAWDSRGSLGNLDEIPFGYPPFIPGKDGAEIEFFLCDDPGRCRRVNWFSSMDAQSLNAMFDGNGPGDVPVPGVGGATGRDPGPYNESQSEAANVHWPSDEVFVGPDSNVRIPPFGFQGGTTGVDSFNAATGQFCRVGAHELFSGGESGGGSISTFCTAG